MVCEDNGSYDLHELELASRVLGLSGLGLLPREYKSPPQNQALTFSFGVRGRSGEAKREVYQSLGAQVRVGEEILERTKIDVCAHTMISFNGKL